jgi:hypothetical protein
MKEEQINGGENQMKNHINRLFAIAAIGILGACVSAIPMAAQNKIQGRFTLSHEIRWQNANLPAGDYTFVMESSSRTSPMVVTGPNGSVFQLPSVISQTKAGNRSALILERRGGMYVVSEMDLAQVGLKIQYRVPHLPKSEQELAQGPAATEQVLIAMATK